MPPGGRDAKQLAAVAVPAKETYKVEREMLFRSRPRRLAFDVSTVTLVALLATLVVVGVLGTANLPSIALSEVFPVVWFAAVAAPVGSVACPSS